VAWLQEELVAWCAEVLSREFGRQARHIEMEGLKTEEFLAQRLAGLSITPAAISASLRVVPVDRDHPSKWTASDRTELARELLRIAKPRLIVANKCDRAQLTDRDRLTEAIAPLPLVATSADQELTLRRAARAGLVRYRPGDASFVVAEPERLSGPQRKALDGIAETLKRWGSTGVQQSLESMIFDRLHRMVVYPVEDETHWTDSRGRMLPDAFLLPVGTTARAMAYRVHSDLGENFIRAIDARTHRALAAEHPVEPNSIVRIVARK
jgi:ribosome-binding ATPase YchF (GTP1/OBG family)